MSDKPIDADCAGELTILPGERVDELQQAGLRILQKEQGFRFGMDAVLLSSFVRAESRDRCADFGTGTGILPLLLAGMGRAKSVDAFEIQPDMADMARRSVRLNGLGTYHPHPRSAGGECRRGACARKHRRHCLQSAVWASWHDTAESGADAVLGAPSAEKRADGVVQDGVSSAARQGADGGHLPGSADAGSNEGHGEGRACAEAVPADLPLGAKGGESGDD